jgi:curved DNA-binding protein CbpA
MKRIVDSRKLFDITTDISLAELKLKYRSLVKEWHPDKFRETDDLRAEAEQKSQAIIDAYHFLVSISPETHALNEERYTQTITDCFVEDFIWKGHALKVTFQDGSTYEYFGVPRSLYIKLVNASTQSRFVRRHIVGGGYTYRNVSKNAAVKL